MSRDPLAAVGGLNGLLADEVESYGRAIAERNLARDAAVCLEQELAAAEAENAELRAELETTRGSRLWKLRDDHCFGFHDTVPHSQCGACAERSS